MAVDTIEAPAAVTPPPASASNEDAQPIVDVLISEATDDLTGYEITAIERYFGCGMESLTGTKLLMGCIWAYEGRAAGKAVSWARVNEMKWRDMQTYFRRDPETQAEADEEGKG